MALPPQRDNTPGLAVVQAKTGGWVPAKITKGQAPSVHIHLAGKGTLMPPSRWLGNGSGKMFYRGTLVKRLHLKPDECIDIVGRADGSFQFIHRQPCNDNISAPTSFESPPYTSADAAEEAARQRFKL